VIVAIARVEGTASPNPRFDDHEQRSDSERRNVTQLPGAERLEACNWSERDDGRGSVHRANDDRCPSESHTPTGRKTQDPDAHARSGQYLGVEVSKPVGEERGEKEHEPRRAEQARVSSPPEHAACDDPRDGDDDQVEPRRPPFGRPHQTAEEQKRSRHERHDERVLAAGQVTVLEELLDVGVPREVVARERMRHHEEEDQEADAQKRAVDVRE
jgi:hypothetical protein